MSADELKAAGNKAIAEKNFDEAMYVHHLRLYVTNDRY
jgi:hypothetical protein